MGFVRRAAEIEAEATMVETTKSPEKRRRSYYQLKDRALRVGTFKSGAMRGQASGGKFAGCRGRLASHVGL